MAWWGAGVDERPELERLAAEVQEIFLGMPPDHRAQVADTIRAMVTAASGLAVVPEEIGGAIGKIVMRVFAEMKNPFGRKPTPDEIAANIGRGAGGLLEQLGVTPEQIAQLVGGK